MTPASFSLFWRFTSLNASRKSGILENGSRSRSRFRSVIHRSRRACALMSSISPGLASTSQRRGATPFVLLLNFSGQIFANSGTKRS